MFRRPIRARRFDQAEAPGADEILESDGTRNTAQQAPRYRFDEMQVSFNELRAIKSRSRRRAQ